MKTRATLYTMEQRDNAQANIARYGWAREQRDRAVAAAAPWLRMAQKLWSGSPADDPAQLRCRQHVKPAARAAAVHAFGNYPYTDIRRHFWKRLPRLRPGLSDNDFAAYYQGD